MRIFDFPISLGLRSQYTISSSLLFRLETFSLTLTLADTNMFSLLFLLVLLFGSSYVNVIVPCVRCVQYIQSGSWSNVTLSCFPRAPNNQSY